MIKKSYCGCETGTRIACMRNQNKFSAKLYLVTDCLGATILFSSNSIFFNLTIIYNDIGVCLSHAAILDSMSQFNVNKASDVFLNFSSLYWLSGVIVLLKGTLTGATRVITTEPFSPELQLRLIEKYKVTFTLNAPHHIILMMKSDQFSKTDLSSLRLMMVGGSKVPFHVQTEMSYHLPNGNVYVGYGKE